MRDSDWRILYELRRTSNLTKTAGLLYMTQPAITKRLKQMEEEWGAEIVLRTPRGLSFTAEGELLAEQAGKYLSLFQETKEQLSRLKEEKQAKIVIAASYTYSKYNLADVLVPYQAAHPEVRFHILNDSSDALFRQVAEGTADVGFVRGDYDGPVNRIFLGETRAYLATKEAADFDALPGMQRLEYRTNQKTEEILAAWWRERFNTAYPAGMMVGHIDGVWKLIYEGLGCALVFLPENFENRYELSLTPLCHRDGSPVTRKTWFIYPKEKRLFRELEEFIRYIEGMRA